jgi:hypothetical protein
MRGHREVGDERGAALAVGFGLGIQAQQDAAGQNDVHPLRGANLWCHEHVIEAVMAQIAVIPLRFGTIVADLAACHRMLSQHYRQLTARLTLVNDRVEFGLRLSGKAAVQIKEPLAPSGPGTAYLRVLAKTSSAWPIELKAALCSALEPWVVASLLWPRDTLSSDLRASFLVERSEIEAFRQEVTGFQNARQDLLVSCTGPWPPYSFVDDAFSERNDRKAKQ